MSTLNNNFTLCYQYGNEDLKYVFSCHGRPFLSLLSSNLPTPTSTLIDYRLVKDLGLKMADLQCKKFYFAGHKMRILGKVSTTIQTIHNGYVSGNFQLKALVVLDLANNLDTDSVIGTKMSSQIHNRATTSPGRTSPPPSTGRPSPPTTPPQGRPSPPPTPPHGRPSPPPTPPEGRPSPTPSSTGRPTPPVSSPPGFPPSPLYLTGSVSVATPSSPHVAVSLLSEHGQMSPLSANLHALQMTFFGADTEPDPNVEVNAILRYDDKGDLGLYDNLQMRYILSNGLVYRTGHGRDKCNYDQCVLDAHDENDVVSHNCGFHPQWLYPPWFKCCGSLCRGAFCNCLRNYEF